MNVLEFPHPAVAPPDAGAGVALGLLCAATVVAGPLPALIAAALMMAVLVRWVQAAPGNAELLRGLGVGALVGLAAAKGLFASAAWGETGCTGFTTEPWRVALLLAAVPSLLAVTDERLIGRTARAAAAALLGATALLVGMVIAPTCFN